MPLHLHIGNRRLALAQLQRFALIAGGVGLAASVLGLLLDAEQFFRSYLFAYLLVLSPALGSLALLLVHHLTRGLWGFPLQRPLEAATRTLPLLALLFVPVLFGMHTLYEWTHAAALAEDEILREKSVYLNVPFFVGRAVLYFGVWGALAWLFGRWSARLDRRADLDALWWMGAVAGPGLVALAITLTFASVDWYMSLEPHWFSSIYGLLVLIGMTLQTLALMIVLVAALRPEAPLRDLLTTKHFHDYGNLLLALVVLWTYMDFMQFAIIWMGNLPEEISWYTARLRGGWEWVAIALVVFYFAVPFGLLLIRRAKEKAAVLARLAAALLALRVVDVLWHVAPAFHPENLYVHWLDVALLVGLGGLWLGAFCWLLGRRPLLPLHDPRIERTLGTAAEEGAP